MIKYIVKGIKDRISGSQKFYPQIAPTGYVTVDDIAERVAENCTLTAPDVKGILSSLQDLVNEAIANGRSVKLGDLGSFRPTISGTGSATAEEVSADNIRSVNVCYRMSPAMKAALTKGAPGVTFQHYATVAALPADDASTAGQ